jgi:hypothetical protein
MRKKRHIRILIAEVVEKQVFSENPRDNTNKSLVTLKFVTKK